MINLVSNLNKQINFGRKDKCCAVSCNEKTANIEKKMNKLFGVTLDEFVKVCDDRKKAMDLEARLEELDDCWEPCI